MHTVTEKVIIPPGGEMPAQPNCTTRQFLGDGSLELGFSRDDDPMVVACWKRVAAERSQRRN